MSIARDRFRQIDREDPDRYVLGAPPEPGETWLSAHVYSVGSGVWKWVLLDETGDVLAAGGFRGRDDAMEAAALAYDAERARVPAGSHGYTLVEILVVIAIIGVVVALLMPVLAAARRSAFRAAQQAEFEVLSQALASFRSDHGDYPPSAVILDERGDYSPAHLLTLTPSERALAQRSLASLGKLFPRVRLSTAGPVSASGIPGGFYDFNGNGVMDAAPVVLTGDECLVFFLDGTGRLPTNPWRPGEDRTRRFAWRPGALIDPDGDGFPSYADQLSGRVVAYFAAVSVGQYDPRDLDDTGETGAAFTLPSGDLGSHGPNPYTDGPAKRQDRPARWHRPESFQLISAGHDGRFGPGGQWSASESGQSLPGDGREDEYDNVTNFNRGMLGRVTIPASGETRPYLGYVGRYAFDPREGVYRGRVIGIIDIVTFQSHTLGRIDLEFRLAVDAYLDFKSRG